MKRALFLASLALAGCATLEAAPPVATGAEISAHVFENKNVRMQLMPGPCTDASSLMMTIAGGAGYAGRWHAIRSSWRGQDGSWREFAGCWLELSAKEAKAPGEVLVLIFEDGERYVVLKRDFLRQRGV